MSTTDALDVLIALDAAPAAGGSGWMGMVGMIAIMGAIMYFMIYRPQKKERDARAALLSSLIKGDEVVTNAGIHGKVVGVDETTLRIEIAEKTRVTVDKDAIARKKGEPASDDSQKK
ncbi:MAG: preprotein translocase subunit YajC [Kiritimatiellia bacterium]|jgi:preprotein translocase subunit YajC